MIKFIDPIDPFIFCVSIRDRRKFNSSLITLLNVPETKQNVKLDSIALYISCTWN
jgi:hypothetical protein